MKRKNSQYYSTRNLFCKTGASFSSDETQMYRYSLFRRWDETKPNMVWCMLNPSTADDIINDPTITRCQRRAEVLGFGGIVIVNLFAWRSTDPFVLPELSNPIGPRNDEFIIAAAKDNCGIFICGWGNFGRLLNRGEKVLDLVRSQGVIPHALKINADGSPQHPLYVGYEVQPFPMS